MSIQRPVPLLNSRAFDEERNLFLRNSRRFITEILGHRDSHPALQSCQPSELLEQYEQSVASLKPYMVTVRKQILMSQYHEDVVVRAKALDDSDDWRLLHLSETIREFVGRIKSSVGGYPDQVSQSLLHLMELWVLMDKEAVERFPLLLEFHPGFDPDILDPIQALTVQALERVQLVQTYLAERCQTVTGKRNPTIFIDPSDDCFAARYYDSFEISQDLFEMRLQIEESAESACLAKEEEWEQKFERHRDLIDKRNEKECKWDNVRARSGLMEPRHRWPCDWHELQDAAKNIRITIHEHPLPELRTRSQSNSLRTTLPCNFRGISGRDLEYSLSSLPTSK